MSRNSTRWLGLGAIFSLVGQSSLALAQVPGTMASPQSAYSLPGDVGAGAGSAQSGRTLPPGGSMVPGDVGAPGVGSSGLGGGAAGTVGGAAAGGAGTAPTTPSPFAPPEGGATDGLAGEGLTPSLFSGVGGTAGGSGTTFFGMIGDGAPTPRLSILARPGNVPQPPGIPNPSVPPVPPRIPRVGTGAVALLPSIQQLKLCENQSPKPQDRIYFTFNSFNNLNDSLNQRFGSQFTDVNVYRYVLGLEKTFFEGRASAGLRLPINNLTSVSRLPGFGGTSTAAGDLAAIFKYAFWDDRDNGNLMSMGLMVSMPTGPGDFAGARGFRSLRNTALTPFVGYIFARGDFYLQGFTSLEVPLDDRDATVLYNDIGVGYYAYKAPEPDRFLTAIAPTFEVHVNTPLNNRGLGLISDTIFYGYDVVNLTSGCNFVLGQRGVLTLAVVNPVTGPRPFDIETVAQFNIRF